MSEDTKVRMTDEQVEALCLADYAAVAGQVVLATEVERYDLDDISETVYCNPPVMVRVAKMDENGVRQNVTRWMANDVCDPTYDIEILDASDPRFHGLRASWIHGRSHYRDGRMEHATFAPAPE